MRETIVRHPMAMIWPPVAMASLALIVGCSSSSAAFGADDAVAVDAASPDGTSEAPDASPARDAGASRDAGPIDSSSAHDARSLDGSTDAGSTCAAGAWCLDTTVPPGFFLGGVWGTSADDLWAAGQGSAGAAILHRDAAGWSVVPVTGDLFGMAFGGLCGTGPKDVWAVGRAESGGGILFHYDGSAWTNRTPAPEQEPELNPLHSCIARSPTDVWLLDSVGAYHFDGTTLPPDPTSEPFRPYTLAVAGGSAWIGGNSGNLDTFAGSSWTPSTLTTPYSFTASFAFSASDVWMAAADTFAHWNGGAWKTTPRSILVDLASAYGAAPNDIWAVGRTTVAHWDGSSWTEHASGFPYWLDGVWGDASGFWAVGHDAYATDFSGPSVVLRRAP